MLIRQWLEKGSPFGLVFLGVVVGVGGSFGAALFHAMIYLSTLIFFGHDGSTPFLSVISSLPSWQRILIPTLGGLLVGLIFKVAKVSEAEGEGVPEVMEALAHKSGTIRPIVAPVKIITAAITLGSGGSAGREGPVIQIGSTIGSSIAQYFKQNTLNRSLLLAAGAAAAIGGTFGAPIAGVLFTSEILRQKITLTHGGVIVIAAAIGFYLTSLITGHNGLRFIVDTQIEYSLSSITSLFLIALLSAAAAILFSKSLSFGKFAFLKIHAPQFIKPAIGGFFVGLIGLYLPYVHEPAAYPLMIDIIKLTTLPLTLLLIIFLMKMLATGITLGSGGSGGIFAPLLLTGALLGGIVGAIFASLGIASASLPLLVFVGMAAVFAAGAHAPLTATFIVYEMTENLSLLPLLLIATYTAYFTIKLSKQKSLYHLPSEQ